MYLNTFLCILLTYAWKNKQENKNTVCFLAADRKEEKDI